MLPSQGLRAALIWSGEQAAHLRAQSSRMQLQHQSFRRHVCRAMGRRHAVFSWASAITNGKLTLSVFKPPAGHVLLDCFKGGRRLHSELDIQSASISEASVQDLSRCGYRAKRKSAAHPLPCHPSGATPKRRLSLSICPHSSDPALSY